MSVWERLTGVYLAIPFDWALDPDEERAAKRAQRYLEAAGVFCSEETRITLKSLWELVLYDYAVPKDGQPSATKARHPLSGEELRELPAVDPDAVCRVIEELVRGLDDPCKKAWAIWRLLPERLATLHPGYACLPAVPSLPSLPVWGVLDAVAALAAALPDEADGLGLSKVWAYLQGHQPEPEVPEIGRPQGGVALAVAHLAKVHRFIGQSRTTRDLWAASLAVSRAMYEALWPFVERLGPACVLWPSLRRNPWIDRYLKTRLNLPVPEPDDALSRLSTLPNTALVVGPIDSLWELETSQPRSPAAEVLRLVVEHWREHAGGVELPSVEELARHVAWPAADLHAETLQWVLVMPPVYVWGGEVADVPNRLLRSVLGADERALENPSGGEGPRPLWWEDLVHFTMCAEAGVRVPRFGTANGLGIGGPKCTLCGEAEQVGPKDYDGARQFWRRVQGVRSLRGIRLGRRDRLCATHLALRFLPAYLDESGEVPKATARVPDTPTIAAWTWLKRAQELGYNLDPDTIWQTHGFWTGGWLHWPSPDYDPDEPPCPTDLFETIQRAKSDRSLGRPPVYLAVLRADGDQIGSWLQGLAGPAVRDLLAEAVVAEWEQDELKRAALAEPAPLTPAYQWALSEALNAYARDHVVPTVAQFHGWLVYAGGDDVLALLPSSTAVSCAAALRDGFSKPLFERDGSISLGPGKRMTLSAGIAFVHYKHSLRFALEAAKEAERAAKAAGRDRLALSVCRRSGEHTTAICPWPFTGTFQRWVKAFQDGASDRWVMDVYRLREPLIRAGWAAFEAELARRFERSEPQTTQAFGGTAQLLEDLRAYRRLFGSANDDSVATNFLELMLTASFFQRPTVRGS